MSGSLARRIVSVLAVLGVAAASPVAGQDPDITVTFATGVEPNGDPWHLVEASVWTFDIIAPKTLVVLASFRTRTVADRAAGRAGSTVEGIYENREPIPAGSVAKVDWAGALRGLEVFSGEEWPEPHTFERLEGVKVRVWGDDSVYTMPCREKSPSPTRARVFDCWLASTGGPNGEDIGIAFADSSDLGDRVTDFYPYTFAIEAEALTVLTAFARGTESDRAAGRVTGFEFCQYRSREAVPAMGGWRPLHWLGCDDDWPEPRTFARLGATDGHGGEHRGGVSVTISEDGRTYDSRCEDVSEAGKGRRFACWILW